MPFIRIFAKNESDKDEILEWMIQELYEKGHMSLMDLLYRYVDVLRIEDNDVLSYHDVGWNALDILWLEITKRDRLTLEIPCLKCRFEPHYT